jgi:uncharacterized protein YjiK
MNRFIPVLLASLCAACYACTLPGDRKEKSALSFLIPDKQYTVFNLPPELNEISGIAFKDSNTVLAVEDEHGYIYQFDLRKKKVVARTTFAGKGDYEDLAIVHNDIYVVNSAGNLYHVRNFLTGKNVSTMKITTPLGKKNDVEGLCYDRFHNRLLLAAKAKGLEKKKNREVFAFNLEENRLDTVPAYSLSMDEIERYFKGDALEESSKKFLKAVGNKNMNDVFTTSALAVHPDSHHIYMLSSANHLIAVLSGNNELLSVIPLKGPAFIQPEGLAFAPGGKLYVSNEGRKMAANIIRLEHEK